MLIPAEQEIAQFVDALFRYAEEGTYISLRAFDQRERGRPPLLIKGVQIKGDMAGVVKDAVWAAERAANSEFPAMFAPPVATFNNPNRARFEDVACGVALSVDVDSGDPRVALQKLEAVLGPATFTMASGGDWVDPETGEVHNKMHLHWRLSEPTMSPADHAMLQDARRLAALYVGADLTNAPPSHPLRWPGSWNRKASPRLAMRHGGNVAAEIHLVDAFERLAEVVEAAGLGGVDLTEHVSGEAQAPVQKIVEAVQHIPNSDVSWVEWNKLGMTIFRASGGSLEGLEAWDNWSAKSSKHEIGACETRWVHFRKSPPARLGAGTLFYMAKAAGWAPPARHDHTQDEGYWASVEADMAMTPVEWHEVEQRGSGKTIPASAEAKAAAGKSLLWIITEAWDEAAIPQRPWIARGYLMRGAVTVVSGPGSAGKSSLMIAWASCLAVDCAFGQFRLAKGAPFKVATYNVEDDADEQKRRFSAMAARLRIKPENFEGRLAILGPERVGTLLHMPRDGRPMLNTPVMDKLMEFVERFRPDVLILDPFVELHGAEENDNTAVRAVMAALRSMAVEYHMSVVILHHARKGAGTPGDPDSLRGASSIVGAARVALTVNVMTEDEAKAFNIRPELRRNYFRLDGAKSNYAPIGEAEWFERQERHLANNDGVAVAWPWTPPNLLKQAPIADIQRVLETINAGYEDGVPFSATKRGNSNKRWVGNIIAEMLHGNEEQAREIAAKWLRSGLLYEITFYDPTTRRNDAKGVKVDFSKRPEAGFEGGITE